MQFGKLSVCLELLFVHDSSWGQNFLKCLDNKYYSCCCYTTTTTTTTATITTTTTTTTTITNDAGAVLNYMITVLFIMLPG